VTTVLDRVRAIAAEVSNWGRWGDDDERGTVNLIDAAAVRRGAAAVVDGTAVPLSIPMDLDGPRLMGQASRIPPLRTLTVHNFAWTGDPATGELNDDTVAMGLQSCTHWDALSHVGYGGQLYNGFATSAVTAEGGATRCGIDKVGPVVSRGVLLDVARYRGVDRLQHGEIVTADELAATAGDAGVEVEPGDIVLIRTGAMGAFRAGDRKAYEHGSAGIDPDCARWFRQTDAAAYAIDAQNPDPFPPQDDSVFLPFHLLALRDLGLLQGQNWDLEALAQACAADGRYTFQLHATPEPFTGGSGAPVAPVAVR
jgi:kynurenine formamidase